MNFCGTTGTLTGLYGAVTYKIQVAAVTVSNEQELENGNQVMCTYTCDLICKILT